MADFGLTSAGFFIKTLATIRADLQSAIRSALGASMDVGDRSIIGQILGILAEAIALVWELAEAVNSSQDPDKATGAALEAICALTGTFRTPASHSTVTLVLGGANTTPIPTGSTARTASTQQVFETIEDVTLSTAAAWDTLVDYVVGNIVTNGGNVYYCKVAADNTKPAPTHTQRHVTVGLFSSAAFYWVWLSAGDAAATATARSQGTGPVVAAADDLEEIVSAIPGWNGVFNPADAVPGRDQATDEELRILREAELTSAGNSPLDAIRADMLKLTDVTACRVFMNVTDVTDVDGMPPHSVEALVQGGTTQVIVDQLLASVAAGIATTGNTTGTATDSQGTDWTIKFSRPVEVAIYVAVSLIKDPDTYEGDDAVKVAIAELDDGQVVGRDAVASRIVAACFGVDGVLDVTSAFLDDAPGPVTTTTVAISLRKLATYSVANVAVTSIDGVP